MSYELPGFKQGVLTAAVDLSALQYTFAKMTPTGVQGATATTDPIIGVIQNKPAAGASVELVSSGITKLVAGAVVNAGDKITTNASGQVITYVSPAAYTVGAGAAQGIALETSGGAGEKIAVQLFINHA